MLIDPLTVFAQIVNFVILVALLKRFLYRPILKAMKQREEYINGQLQEAAVQQAIAREEAEDYRQRQQELEQQRETLEAQIRLDVDQYRQTLLQQIRTESDQKKKKWSNAIKQEQTAFLKMLRQQAGSQLVRIIRQALHDLAQASLEHQIVDVFITRLESLPSQEKTLLNHALLASSSQDILIESAFPLSEADQLRLKESIFRQVSSHESQSLQIKFEQRLTVICGIELILPGYKLAWTVDHYLQTFDDNLIRILESQNTRIETSLASEAN